MIGRREVDRLRKRLDSTFSRAPSALSEIELQSDFARYLCVLVSGFLECAIVALAVDFAQRRSSPEVASFVERQLDRWTNANSEKICTLMGSFDPAWNGRTSSFLDDQRRDGINSVVALRHKIAHGESVGTSLSQIRAYYATVLEVVYFIADIFDPPP
jgi:hypothetical protein